MIDFQSYIFKQQVSIMNSDLLQYLQQQSIGKVIARGLADVYTHKPAAPVKYLAAWLKKYSSNQHQISELGKQQSSKINNLKTFESNVKKETDKVQQEKRKVDEHDAKIQNFKKAITQHEYQEELLKEWLPEFLEKEFQLTGVYIGYIDHPPKDFTEDDEQENAHLNTSIAKLINYIGSSKSHAELMLGKQLPLDKGVTGGALSLSLDDPQPAEDGTVEVKDKYVYIPNVVKNENMHYFRLPKLGAYIAVPLVYNSYLTEGIFDVALEARLKYLGELEEWQKTKAEEIKQIETQKQTLEQKLTEHTEKNDEAGIESIKGELAEIQKHLKEKQSEAFEEEHTELSTEKREFLVCGDTLGFDKEISEAQRQILLELVKHFRDNWQHKEKQLLYKDVQYQISIQKHLDKKQEAVIEELNKVVEVSAQSRAHYNQIEDEQLREYKISEWQLGELKKCIREGPQYLASFFKLKNFRVVKYKEIISTILHFLKLEKKDINLQGKNCLDWKKIRAKEINANTFFAVIDYVTEGPKTQEYPNYCKINHILQKLEKYNENSVFDYNVGLGAVVRLIKKQLSHRLANIQLRRQRKQNEKKQRNLLLEENEKITEEKRQALEKHKQTLIGEDLESFKQEEWSASYDQANPLKEIPPEIVDDIDNDL